MGRRYISEAEFYDATLQQKLAGRLALPYATPGPSAGFARLSAEQRRALAMLTAAGRDGVIQRLLTVLGFRASMLAGLVNQGLATVTSSKVRAGGKLIEVGRVRIKGRWAGGSRGRMVSSAGRVALPT